MGKKLWIPHDPKNDVPCGGASYDLDEAKHAENTPGQTFDSPWNTAFTGWTEEDRSYSPVHEDAIFLSSQIPISVEFTKPVFDIVVRIDAREAKVADLEARLAQAEARLKQFEQGTDAVLDMLTFGTAP